LLYVILFVSKTSTNPDCGPPAISFAACGRIYPWLQAGVYKENYLH
jgi:hypothetical protein